MSDAQTPSAQVIAERSTPEVVTDTLGRKLTLRKIGALQKFRLFKACGLNANSSPYLGIAMLVSAVSFIQEPNGEPVPVVQPVNEQQLEALVSRLGDEGLDAIGKAFAPNEELGEDVVASAKT